MEKINAVITGVGGYVPDYILTNEEISKMVERLSFYRNVFGCFMLRWLDAFFFKEQSGFVSLLTVSYTHLGGDINMCLGENIRFLRTKKGYSQDDIANMLGYKSFTTIQKRCV